MVITCSVCDVQFESAGARGRTASYCSSACRQKAYRARGRVKKTFVDSVGDRWVRADHKRPIMPDGSSASSTNSATWSSFEAVRTGAGDGFGLMVGGGLGCYDLDHVIVDGELEPWVLEFVGSIPEPILFMETSMSGTGVHIFIGAPESRGSRQGQVERYTKERFIRTTLDEFKL